MRETSRWYLKTILRWLEVTIGWQLETVWWQLVLGRTTFVFSFLWLSQRRVALRFVSAFWNNCLRPTWNTHNLGEFNRFLAHLFSSLLLMLNIPFVHTTILWCLRRSIWQFLTLDLLTREIITRLMHLSSIGILNIRLSIGMGRTQWL